MTDPRDKNVKLDMQVPCVEKLKKARGQVEQFFVDVAGDDRHHFTMPYATAVMADCLRVASNQEIATNLSEMVAKRHLAERAKHAKAAPGTR